MAHAMCQIGNNDNGFIVSFFVQVWRVWFFLEGWGALHNVDCHCNVITLGHYSGIFLSFSGQCLESAHVIDKTMTAVQLFLVHLVWLSYSDGLGLLCGLCKFQVHWRSIEISFATRSEKVNLKSAGALPAIQRSTLIAAHGPSILIHWINSPADTWGIGI